MVFFFWNPVLDPYQVYLRGTSCNKFPFCLIGRQVLFNQILDSTADVADISPAVDPNKKKKKNIVFLITS